MREAHRLRRNIINEHARSTPMESIYFSSALGDRQYSRMSS